MRIIAAYNRPQLSCNPQASFPCLKPGREAAGSRNRTRFYWKELKGFLHVKLKLWMRFMWTLSLINQTNSRLLFFFFLLYICITFNNQTHILGVYLANLSLLIKIALNNSSSFCFFFETSRILLSRRTPWEPWEERRRTRPSFPFCNCGLTVWLKKKEVKHELFTDGDTTAKLVNTDERMV